MKQLKFKTVKVLKPQSKHDLGWEDAVLLHQICEAVDVHCGETTDTNQSYICPLPVVSTDFQRAAPTFIFGFANGSLYLQRAAVGTLNRSEPVSGPQEIVEFQLADPEFFTKVRNHVHEGWNPCEPTRKSKSSSEN